MFNLLHACCPVFQCWFPGEVQHVLLLEGHVCWPARSQITAVIQVSRFNLRYNALFRKISNSAQCGGFALIL